MKFEYSGWGLKPTDAFPDQHSVLRPIIQILIKYQDKKLAIPALLDTGSDWCLFHESMGKVLGVPIEEGKKIEFAGSTGLGVAYFHHVTLVIGGWPHKCFAGFTPDLDKVGCPCAVLGHKGFFDRYNVTFNFKKKTIEVKKNI